MPTAPADYTVEDLMDAAGIHTWLLRMLFVLAYNISM